MILYLAEGGGIVQAVSWGVCMFFMVVVSFACCIGIYDWFAYKRDQQHLKRLRMSRGEY